MARRLSTGGSLDEYSSVMAVLRPCACFPILKPLVPQFMPVLISHIQSEPRLAEVSVCNNRGGRRMIGERARPGVAGTWRGDSAPEGRSTSTALVPQFMPVLISHIQSEPRLAEVSVCNNAAWAAGEMARPVAGRRSRVGQW
jgi:hypothetical protein